MLKTKDKKTAEVFKYYRQQARNACKMLLLQSLCMHCVPVIQHHL